MTIRRDDDNMIKEVEEALGKPVLCDLSDKAWRVRTNLIIASVVSIAMVLGGLHIKPGSSVLGLQFDGLTDDLVRNILFWITLYLLLHFVWNSIDNFLEWRLRITGTRLAFVTTAIVASDHGDYPSDPRQSTLYSWWQYQANKIGNIVLKTSEIEKSLDELNNKLNDNNVKSTNPNIAGACIPTLVETRDGVHRLVGAIESVAETVKAARIPISLKRFDNWFGLFLRSQNLRWLVIDFSVPIFIAASALFLLTR